MNLTTTYTVHDYYGYRETGSQVHNNGSTFSYYNLWDITDIGDFELTGQVSADTNKGFAFGVKELNSNVNDNYVRVQVDGGGMKGVYSTKNGNATYNPVYSSYSTNEWLTFKIRFENGVPYTEYNGSVWNPTTYPSDVNFVGIFGWSNNKTINFKNIILKKL